MDIDFAKYFNKEFESFQLHNGIEPINKDGSKNYEGHQEFSEYVCKIINEVSCGKFQATPFKGVIIVDEPAVDQELENKAQMVLEASNYRIKNTTHDFYINISTRINEDNITK